jgi:glycosyltransferase involved in cell wall biosynthesis
MAPGSAFAGLFWHFDKRRDSMSSSKTATRIAFLVSNFRQGRGGVPEAVRLMAQVMLEDDCVSDVVIGGRVFENVGTFPRLPGSHDDAVAKKIDYSSYDLIIVVGPWQSPFGIAKALFCGRGLSRFIYVPKGGLARIEFSRSRDLKKIPYLYLVEVLWLLLAHRIVFSSKLEMNSLYLPISLFRSKCTIIPDLFLPSWPSIERPEAKRIRFSFLAEIHPRKGLEEVMYGFHDWVVKNKLMSKVVFRVGGQPRPGSQNYCNRVKQFVESTPLNECVEFVGPVAHEERIRFYADSDVFFATSQFESYCLTVLEALHSGCMVLAGPNLGVLEYVGHHHNLLTLSDLSRGAIAEGLERISERLDKHEACGDPSGNEPDSVEVSQLVNSIAVQRWRDLLELRNADEYKTV